MEQKWPLAVCQVCFNCLLIQMIEMIVTAITITTRCVMMEDLLKAFN